MRSTSFTILLFLSFLGISAQSPFNTVSKPHKLYSVEVIAADAPFNIETGAVMLDDAPLIEEEDDEPLAADSTESRRMAFIEQYLSVCMPLKEKRVVSSPYGERTNPFKRGKKEMHRGLDLKANYTQVYAMLPGVVEKTGADKRSGIFVTLRHGEYTVSYCHLSSSKVHKGDIILPGDVVGVTGNTGRSTGPHLHITVKFRNKHIDPAIMIEYIERVKREAIEGLAAERIQQ